MIDLQNMTPPSTYEGIKLDTEKTTFDQTSDWLIGIFLRMLIATKPSAHVLELGTGSGYGSSWLLDGMDAQSQLTTVDTSEELTAIAKKYLGHDPRINIIVQDGCQFISEAKDAGTQYDLIFADAYPGKYEMFEEGISLLSDGGIYVLDDMLPQSNWPNGHDGVVAEFLENIETDERFWVSKMNWSTGIVLLTKRPISIEMA